jgi:hypothetical protein
MEGNRDENLYRRWSARKLARRDDDRTGPRSAPDGDDGRGATGATGAARPADGDGASGQRERREPPPDLETLDGDSDYSRFLADDIDEDLHRRALRKLFHSPKFNIIDGLDDYCEDFTRFEALGSLVTSDMKHHIDRMKELAESAGLSGDGPASASAGDREQGATGAGGPDDGGSGEEPDGGDRSHA